MILSAYYLLNLKFVQRINNHWTIKAFSPICPSVHILRALGWSISLKVYKYINICLLKQLFAAGQVLFNLSK